MSANVNVHEAGSQRMKRLQNRVADDISETLTRVTEDEGCSFASVVLITLDQIALTLGYLDPGAAADLLEALAALIRDGAEPQLAHQQRRLEASAALFAAEDRGGALSFADVRGRG